MKKVFFAVLIIVVMAGCSNLQNLIDVDLQSIHATLLEAATAVGEFCEAPASVNGDLFTLRFNLATIQHLLPDLLSEGDLADIDEVCAAVKTGTWLKLLGSFLPAGSRATSTRGPAAGRVFVAEHIKVQNDG